MATGDVRMLYLAPERLMTERMIAALQRLDVTLIAIDEAHCISQWGASFRPEYDALQTLQEAFPGVPIGAFTATADEATRRDIVAKLFGGTAEVFVAGFDRPNIKLTVEAKDNAKKQLLDFPRRSRRRERHRLCPVAQDRPRNWRHSWRRRAIAPWPIMPA